MNAKPILTFLVIVLLSHFQSLQAALIDLNAIGAITTESGFYISDNGAKAIDGDLLTQWNAGTHGSTSNPQWLKVDLGALYQIDRITLYSYYNNGNWDGYWIGYNLYSSLDATNWGSSLVSGTLYDNPSPAFFDDHFLSTPTIAQHLWFNVTSGSHWAHLREMQVYGTLAQENNTGSNQGQVPVPSPLLLVGIGLLLIGRAYRARPK